MTDLKVKSGDESVDYCKFPVNVTRANDIGLTL